MITKRIIPCLDVKNGRVVKGVNFENLRYAGDPVELAKLVNLPLDTVKKKLKILTDAKIIRVKGINPKCFQFDEYQFQRMDEEDPIYKHLCSFDDVDFDKYFNY